MIDFTLNSIQNLDIIKKIKGIQKITFEKIYFKSSRYFWNTYIMKMKKLILIVN